MKSKLLALSTVAAFGLLAGCTSAQLQSSLQTACQAVGGAASLAATITGVGWIPLVVSQGVGAASVACPQFAAAVNSVVNNLTSTGQTAAVAVTAQTPAAQSRLRRAGFPTVFHFQVAPNGSVTVDSATRAVLAKIAPR